MVKPMNSEWFRVCNKDLWGISLWTGIALGWHLNHSLRLFIKTCFHNVHLLRGPPGLDTIDQDLNLLFCSCPHFCQFVSKLGYGLGWTQN